MLSTLQPHHCLPHCDTSGCVQYDRKCRYISLKMTREGGLWIAPWSPGQCAQLKEMIQPICNKERLFSFKLSGGQLRGEPLLYLRFSTSITLRGEQSPRENAKNNIFKNIFSPLNHDLGCTDNANIDGLNSAFSIFKIRAGLFKVLWSTENSMDSCPWKVHLPYLS